MRGAKAKALRKKVYGDYSIRFRECRKDSNGTLRADARRTMYQNMKKI